MTGPGSPVDKFRHDALLYSGWPDFLAGTVPFIRAGVAASEPVLVVESMEKINMLRTALGEEAEMVLFADMAQVGANPARIIPAWQGFVDRHGSAASRLRGIGEPIWKGRSADELVECQRHEALLNAAFESGRPWWLLCPYNSAELPLEVIYEAEHSHQFIHAADDVQESEDFAAGSVLRPPLNSTLPDPRAPITWQMRFERADLAILRGRVFRDAQGAGLSSLRARGIALALNEVASNSVVHGGGGGVVRMWNETDRLICEIRDHGSFNLPLVDRQRPGSDASASRGLWTANQLCDLVQIRSDDGGTIVRLHMELDVPRRLQVISELN